MNGNHRQLRTVALAATFLLAAPSGVLLAAMPSSGTVNPSSPTVGYGGGPFSQTNQTGTAGPPTEPTCVNPLLPCDDYALTVSVPPGDPNTYFVNVSITFSPSADFDLYLLDSSGNTVAESATGNMPEAVRVQAQAGTHTYTIRVTPYSVTTGAGGDTYTAAVTLSTLTPPPDPPDQPTVPGVPRFQNFHAPAELGNSSGEPSIGADFSSGNVMFQAGLQSLKVGFDDCASPAATTWADVSFPSTSEASLDSIGYTDSRTNRTFVAQLTGACSSSAFTDNDGASWTPGEGCGTPAGVDHETYGGGPFPAGSIGPLTSYPDAVYYCSQETATAFCALSQDGGLSFGPGVAVWTATQCGGIHGHVKVAPDGTAYVPNRACNGDPVNGYANQGLAVSTDAGATWTVRFVTGSTPPKNDYLVDPAVGIGSGGRVYFGYEGSDGHPWIAVSDDQGLVWRHNQDVGAALGIKNSTFPEVVAGDNDRAAFAFLGTMTDGDYGNPSAFNALWHLYVAVTYDGGVTWTTIDATPHDPVQRGSICNKGTTACSNTPDDRNLLDFNDIVVDATGHILVGYADGCITGSCISGTANDFTAKATIARQSGGKGLLAAFDPAPAEPVPPKAPALTGSRTAANVISLSWSIPDNGGADITGYKIYRGTTSGGETLLTTRGAAKPAYDDITGNATTAYYYRIRATNSSGDGLYCSEAFVPATITPGTDPCHTPGVTVATDTSDSAPNVPPQPTVDIQSLSVAEPYGTSGAGELVFTLQVGPGSSAPPSSQWYVLWNRTTPDPGADRNYVAIKTSATGVVSAEYGTISPPNNNLPTRVGAADEFSYDVSTGTIRIGVATSKIDGVVAGQTLTSMQARTFFSRADGLPVTQTASSDFSPMGSYTLVGNASCRVNNAPTAVLTVSPAEGCVPLTVTLDGSASTDPDAGDTIATYQFDFGDGSASVVQSTPTISHTYTAGGDYAARLYVYDSRGKASNNVDLKAVEAHPLPIAAAAGSTTICSGASTALTGSGGVSCSWSPSTGLSDPASCSPSASPAATTTYTLTVVSADGCVSTNQPTVTVTVSACAVAEVAGLAWSGTTKDTLGWSATTNAASYRLYRGTAGDLPSLLNSGLDSCTRFEGAGTTTGAILTEDPGSIPGSLYWYLVDGVNAASVEGPAGSASAGPRIVNSSGPCP
jgi:hypothetical protein